VASVKSINGVANNQATPAVKPLDDVVVTGENSVPSRAGGSITAYHWTMLAADKPAESTVVITNPSSKDTGLKFNSSGQFVAGIDVAGTFTLRLSVTDNDGLTSSNDAHVTINSVPTGGLHVQITWDTGSDDIDLHLLRNHGALCSQDDCFYGNCAAGGFGFGAPNWGGGSNDPHLDIDDTDGFGPENTEVTGPVDGTTYTISINNFRSASSSNVTVKIFLFGALRFQETRTLNSTGVEWAAADVQWSGTPTVVPIDTFDNNPSGSCLGIP
jgi:hypothetical protein